MAHGCVMSIADYKFVRLCVDALGERAWALLGSRRLPVCHVTYQFARRHVRYKVVGVVAHVVGTGVRASSFSDAAQPCIL